MENQENVIVKRRPGRPRKPTNEIKQKKNPKAAQPSI